MPAFLKYRTNSKLCTYHTHQTYITRWYLHKFEFYTIVYFSALLFIYISCNGTHQHMKIGLCEIVLLWEMAAQVITCIVPVMIQWIINPHSNNRFLYLCKKIVIIALSELWYTLWFICLIDLDSWLWNFWCNKIILKYGLKARCTSII